MRYNDPPANGPPVAKKTRKPKKTCCGKPLRKACKRCPRRCD